MKRRIIIFNGIDTFLHLYLRIKFFHNLSFYSFLRRFSCFDFTTRKFPHSLKFTIATCRSKHLIIFTNHRSYYPYCFHLSVYFSITLQSAFIHTLFFRRSISLPRSLYSSMFLNTYMAGFFTLAPEIIRRGKIHTFLSFPSSSGCISKYGFDASSTRPQYMYSPASITSNK